MEKLANIAINGLVFTEGLVQYIGLRVVGTTQHEVHVALQPINAGELQLKKNIEAMELAACFPALRVKLGGCRFERRMKRRLF